MAVNVTANWQLIRLMRCCARPTPGARCSTSGVVDQPARLPRPLRGKKAALEAMVRTYAAETAATPIRVNLFNPGPTRTRMRAAVMPGEDP